MQPPVKSLSSALRLLSFFNSEREEWKVTELAEKAGLHKSQISRILRTFEAHGFIEKTPESGEYRLGRAFRAFAVLVRSDEDLVRISRPIMHELNHQTQGTILLKLRDQGETVTIDKVESGHFLRLGYPIGHRLPLNASASGKVFLAYMLRAEVKELYTQGWFRKFTPNTKMDLTAIEEELAAIRRRGFAVSNEEHLLGARAVAAPIFNGDSVLMATLGVGLPVTLFPRGRIAELGASVKNAAKKISRRLGYKAIEHKRTEIRGLGLKELTKGGQEKKYGRL
jgi:IclR family transcriptional regulator, KDG regulon repressor